MSKEDAALAAWLDELLAEPVAAAETRARTAFDAEVEPFRSRLVLFGAGNMGHRVLARLRQDGIEPLAFADNRQALWGTRLDGLTVLPPNEAARRHGREAAVVVTIYNNGHSFPQTRRQLSELGCAKVVSVVPLRWKYHETFLPYFRDDLPHKVLPQAARIRRAFGLWADQPSRREFVAQVAWRLNADFDLLAPPLPGPQYFPQNLFSLGDDVFFVDAGAYTGDTVQTFLAAQGDAFRGILALEPDPANFRSLCAYLASLPPNVRSRIEARPLAVGGQPGRLRFNAGAGTSAAFDHSGSIEVESVRLDDLLRDRHPTYIKMDIEGAELAAIQGCGRLLREDRPVLAVCVYHAQDHLWSIPLAIADRTERYQLFLRPHMPECWDTVCYAVPIGQLLSGSH
jgi:FkbM family methyltransferase